MISQIWPLENKDLVPWLQQRMQQRGLLVESDAVKMLAARVEGNLLAAAQEIEKLYVLYGESRIGIEQITEAVADNSRYDVYKLADAVLAANGNRIVKILSGLHAEGTAAQIVLWALTREARALIKIKLALSQGQARDTAFRNKQVFENRKALVNAALSRLSVDELNAVLVLSAKADRQSKGQEQGDVWETLRHICLRFASMQTLTISV